MVIAIARSDGGVTTMSILHGSDPDLEIAKWKGVHRGEYISHKELNPEAFPSDQTFRNAWTLSGTAVVVDLTKAKDIFLAKLRLARNNKLSDLDKDFTKYVGQKAQAAADAVELQRQALRDLPTTIDFSTAKSPEDIKALWPAALLSGGL